MGHQDGVPGPDALDIGEGTAVEPKLIVIPCLRRFLSEAPAAGSLEVVFCNKGQFRLESLLICVPDDISTGGKRSSVDHGL